MPLRTPITACRSATVAVRNCHLKDAPPEVSHPKGNPPRVSSPKICSQRQPSEGQQSGARIVRKTRPAATQPRIRGGGLYREGRGQRSACLFFKVTIFSAKSCIPGPIFRPSAIHRPNYQSFEFSTSLRFQGYRTSRRPNRVNAALKPHRRRLGAQGGPNRLSFPIFRGFRSASRPRSSQNPLPDRRKSLPGLVFHPDFSYICF